jgi:hypothetical protein
MNTPRKSLGENLSTPARKERKEKGGNSRLALALSALIAGTSSMALSACTNRNDDPKSHSNIELQKKTAEDFWSAAIAAEKVEDRERAKTLWRKASEQAEAKGNFWSAADAAERAEDSERAKTLWRKASEQMEAQEDFLGAADAAQKAGDRELVKTIWRKFSEQMEAEGDFWSAADAAERAGDSKRAEELRRK